MAYERLSDKKVIATGLGSYIESLNVLITKTRERRNLEDESKFNQSVLDDNLTLDQQLDYRKSQLKRVLPGDKTERTRIKEAISTLNDLIEQKEYSDAYLEQVMALNSGVQSIDYTINWLNKKLAKTTNDDIIKSIKENLSTLYTQRYEQQKNALSKQTDYANNDKTTEVLDTQIAKVQSAKNAALQTGNDDYAAVLDLQLQSLQKTKAETGIKNTLLDYSVATMTGQSALSLLNQFNTQISNADDAMSITIGDTTYSSAKQFWELQRADFLNDRSDSGFFSRYKSELSDQIEYKSSKGTLTISSLDDVKNWYDTLKSRPELSDYQDKISQDQQTSLQSAGDKKAANILNKFATDLDAKQAISDLSYLQDNYGINQTLNYQKVVSSAAQEKQSQINEILSTMQSLISSNPGMTNQQALEQAVSSGAGAMFSPEQLATSKASDIITKAGDTAKAQQFGEETPAVTIDQTKEGSSFYTPTYKEGDLVKLGNSSTVYKYENGKLRAFSGSWDENKFKQYTGKSFSDVKTLSNLGDIPQGTAISAAEVITPAVSATSAVTPTSSYKDGELIKAKDSSTVYKVENGKLRAFTGNWDENKFKQYTGQGFSAVKTVDALGDYQKGLDITYQ